MSWATGLILYCLLLIGIAAVSVWVHGAPMRRRARRRAMIERYSRLEWHTGDTQ
jgi:peptidoglycan/LPS O-acetylase OafA/YrhL